VHSVSTISKVFKEVTLTRGYGQCGMVFEIFGMTCFMYMCWHYRAGLCPLDEHKPRGSATRLLCFLPHATPSTPLSTSSSGACLRLPGRSLAVGHTVRSLQLPTHSIFLFLLSSPSSSLLLYMLSRYHRLVTASVAAFSSLTPAPCSPRCSDQAVLSDCRVALCVLASVSQLHHPIPLLSSFHPPPPSHRSPHQIHGTTNHVLCISLSDYSFKNVLHCSRVAPLAEGVASCALYRRQEHPNDEGFGN
jgi:hypothetical protein